MSEAVRILVIENISLRAKGLEAGLESPWPEMGIELAHYCPDEKAEIPSAKASIHVRKVKGMEE